MPRIIVLLSLLLVSGVAFAFEEDKKESDEGFVSLFDGKTLEGWQGDTKGYIVEDGAIIAKGVSDPAVKEHNLLTTKDYADFILRLEFKVPPGGNNGIALRAPEMGNPAYQGMEIQVLDDADEKYKDLHEYQYCGSVYGVVAAKRGHTKPAGEWNTEEITLKGTHITIKLNGETIVDADLAEASKDGTIDKSDHPGLKRTTGRIGFCGHGDPVSFRNIRIKELK
jgi:hypothetical protein